MSASLDAAKAKVQWAEKHFGDFKDILFGRSTGVGTRKTTVLHYDVQRQSNPGPARFLAPPRECRLAFGDAVHQLRSSLDHIVYALAQPLTTDPKVLRKIDFPIYIDENLFNGSKGVGHLRRLFSADQFAAIVRAQPYKRNPVAPHTEWLWVLSELDNIDKHRTILVVDPRLMTKFRTADGKTTVIKHPLIAGTESFSVALTVPHSPPEVEVQETAFVVVLAETGLACDNITAIQAWRDMVAAVKNVIATFEQFF
jgi:hypothetical protein